MKYAGKIVEGRFVKRPNRFIAMVEIDGVETVCHVKNTGRCKELLLPGATVYLEESTNPNRKTKYDVIAVKKGNRLVNMDSQVPNAVAAEWIKAGGLRPDIENVKREVTYGKSRFDIFATTKSSRVFIEVKGVTLENDGVVRFPDAPTQRGLKHILELCDAVKQGYEAYILFVVQMEGVTCFMPHDEMQKEFGDALRMAQKQGVHVVAVDCRVTPGSLKIKERVKVML